MRVLCHSVKRAFCHAKSFCGVFQLFNDVTDCFTIKHTTF